MKALSREMRGWTILEEITNCKLPVKCGLCGTKSKGIPLLFWYLPCDSPDHY